MFVSYAQNLEDVMLWRALAAVEAGTYVDVGAYHPVEDSVTKAFYDRGWQGINIEPVEELLRRFVEERPRDINMSVALGKEPGKLTFYEIPGTGLSTSEPEIAKSHAEQGFDVRLRVVPCGTLDDVLREHRITEVHFLKVDVEGSERSVLEGGAFDELRPWIVVVEATEPGSPHENYAEWEPAMLNKGYEFAYFDGLNRFYVAREHAELKSHFDVPPNVFDRYVPYSQRRAQQELEQQGHRVQALESEAAALTQKLEVRIARAQMLESELVALQQQLEGQAARAEALEKHIAWLEGELKGMSQSRSWRITAPLRAVMGVVRGRRSAVSGGRIISVLRGTLRGALAPAVRLAMRSPMLRRAGARLLETRPALRRRLLRLAHAGPPKPDDLPSRRKGDGAAATHDLAEPARPIYAELEARLSTSQPVSST
jgi:FkbM family methyltransferase